MKGWLWCGGTLSVCYSCKHGIYTHNTHTHNTHTHNTQHTTRNKQPHNHTTTQPHNTQHTTQHTTHNTQHTTHNTQHTTHTHNTHNTHNTHIHTHTTHTQQSTASPHHKQGSFLMGRQLYDSFSTFRDFKVVRIDKLIVLS